MAERKAGARLAAALWFVAALLAWIAAGIRYYRREEISWVWAAAGLACVAIWRIAGLTLRRNARTIPFRMHRFSFFLGGLAACLVIACRGARPEPEAEPSPATAGEVFSLAVGTWDWWRGDSTCLGNPHEVTFSSDRREMLLTFKAPIDTSTGKRVVRYRILEVGPHLFPEPAHVVRASMEGETRRTTGGDLVIWDLVLATPNRYHWHRTDWEAGAVTRPIVRCVDGRPVERY
jgi:hypothetical protein